MTLMALAGVLPQAAGAIGPQAAERAALRALASSAASGSVVFGSDTAVPAAGAVYYAPLRGSDSDASGSSSSPLPLALRAPGTEPAWLFYEDRAPSTLFEHAGRVVLVGRDSGLARVSSLISGPPVVAGRSPQFVRSVGSSGAPAPTGNDAPPQRPPFAAPPTPPATAASARARAGAQLATDHVCLVRAGGTLGATGPFAAPARATASVGGLEDGLAKLAPGLVSARFKRSSGKALGTYVDELIAAKDCREVSLYIAGAGFQSGEETTIAIGARVDGSRFKRQLVTGSDLRELLRSRPAVQWNLTLDAPHAGAILEDLRAAGNLASAQTSGRPGDPSYIARRPGARGKETLRFTRNLLGGLRSALADEAEISAALADRDGKRAASFLAALLTRGFQRGVGPDAHTDLVAQPQYFLRSRTPIDPGTGASAGSPAGPPAPPITRRPEVSASVTTAAYAENDPAVAVDPGLSVSDTDSTQLVGATVTVASGYVNGADELGFVDGAGIGGSWNAAAGVLTLSGSASVAAYQSALRSVTYRNLSDDPAPTRSLAFQVSDSGGQSAAAAVEVEVTAANDVPFVQLAGGSASYTENAAVAPIDAGLTVLDPDSAQIDSATVAISGGFQAAEDALSLTAPVAGISASYNPGTGVLTLTGPASRADFQAALRAVAYGNSSENPNTASRTISFTLTDLEGDTGPARDLVLSVVAANDAPTVATTGSALAYAENDPATAVDPGLTVSDADSTQLSSATVTVASGYVNGADELGFVDGGGISGAWNTTTGVLTLSGSASVAAYEGALRTVTYRNLSDDPVAGARSIACRVDDGQAQSAASTRGINVTATNDAPDLTLPAAGALSYEEKDPATAIDPGALLSDPDSTSFASATAQISGGLVVSEDVLELTTPVTGISASYNAGTGTLTLTGPGSRADFQAALRAVGYRNSSDNPNTGARTVTLQAEDSAGAVTPARNREIAIGAANDAPSVTTTGTTLGYTENDPATALDPGLTLADPDSPNLAKATVQLTAGYVQGEDVLAFPGASGISGSWDAPSGTLTLTGPAALADFQAALRSVTYANLSDNPPAGGRTATIVVNDGAADSAAATRSIVISVANDAPDVQLAGGSASYTENAAATLVDPTLTVVDPDSATLASATVAISGGFQSAEDALSLTTPVSGIAASYSAGTGVLTLTGPASPADFQTALRAVGYTNSSEDPNTAARTVSFTLTDSEGDSGPTRSRALSVAAVNDTPLAADDNAGSTDEATVLNVTAPGILGNDSDPDGDPLTVVAVNGLPAKVGVAVATGKGATVTVNANGSLSYDPSAASTLRALGEGESTTDTFTYAAGDGSASATATVTVTVNGLPDPPEATNDSYSGVGNTTLAVGQNGPSGQAFKQVSGSVLDNDTDPDTAHASLGVTAKTAATTLGGSVTIAADGKFTYTPPAGSSGSTDSFTYDVSDGKQSDTGTVQIALSGRVWYADNSAAAGGTGVSAKPFNTLAAAASAASAGDTLYVFRGDGANTGQNAGVTLKANQRLLGQAVDLVVGGDTLFDGTAAQRPKVGNSAGTAVTLASGSRVEGLEVTAAGGTAIVGGSGVAGSTLADLVVSGNAGGVALSGSSGTFTVSDLAITTTGSSAFFAENAGTVQFTDAGTISLSSTGARALTAGNVALSGTIDSLSSSGAASGGVAIASTTGSLAFGGLSIASSGSTGFLAESAAGLSIPAAATANVSNTGGPAVSIKSLSSPALAFDEASSANSSGAGFNVDTVSGGSVTASGGTISGAAGAAVDVNAGNGTVTYGGTVNDGNGRPAEVTGRSGGAVTISGNIAEDDTGILVSGNSGGSTEFSGGSKSIATGSGNAVTLSSNTGHTVNFTGGGLVLTTTSGKGFAATGGGTVNLTGSNNTATSTTGTAVEVANTTIGASDLNFRSVSANGGANGIVLNTTGSSGGLTVTGNGTADSGGVIQNMVGSDGSTAGVGAYLNSTADVSLSRMRFTSSQGHAIRGTTVNGFALTNSTINGTNGTNDAVDEGSVSLTGPTGTVAFTDTTVQGGYEDNIDIYPNAGTLNLTMTRLTVGANNTALGGNGLLIVASGTANVTTTVSESDFTASREDLFQHVVQDQAKSNITISDSEFDNNQPEKISGGTGILLQSGGIQNAELTYRIANNKVRDINGTSIFVQKAVGISKAQGRITGNEVGVAGVAESGGMGAITVEARGQGSHVTSITNNVVRRYFQGGIEAFVSEKGAFDSGVVSVDVTATGNTATEPEPNVGAGFRTQIGDPDGTVTICVDLKDNNLAGAANLGTDIRVLNPRPNTTFRLPGYTGGALDGPAVGDYLLARNTATTRLATVPSSGNGYSNAAACAQPPA